METFRTPGKERCRQQDEWCCRHDGQKYTNYPKQERGKTQRNKYMPDEYRIMKLKFAH
jgi:hypothetical protein